jgi:hypothetical protein
LRQHFLGRIIKNFYRNANGNRRNNGTDKKRQLLVARRGAYNVSCFKILRGSTGIGRRNTDIAC